MDDDMFPFLGFHISLSSGVDFILCHWKMNSLDRSHWLIFQCAQGSLPLRALLMNCLMTCP